MEASTGERVHEVAQTLRCHRGFVPTFMRLVKLVEDQDINIRVTEVSRTLWVRYFRVELVGTRTQLIIAETILNSCD